MRLLYGEPEQVLELVHALLPTEQFRACLPVGVIDRSGRLVAGWVWHNHSPEAGTIEFSGASTVANWMTRSLLTELFSYAFDYARCQMVVTRNSAANTRLHRQLKSFGFDRFDIPRLFGRREDAVIWTLTEEKWRASRFTRKADGQKIRPASAA